MNLCRVCHRNLRRNRVYLFRYGTIPIRDNPVRLRALRNLWICFCSLRKHSVRISRTINLSWCRTVCAEKKGQNSYNCHTGCVLLYGEYKVVVFSLCFVFLFL